MTKTFTPIDHYCLAKIALRVVLPFAQTLTGRFEF
jgi:hypothetical protein